MKASKAKTLLFSAPIDTEESHSLALSVLHVLTEGKNLYLNRLMFFLPRSNLAFLTSSDGVV